MTRSELNNEVTRTSPHHETIRQQNQTNNIPKPPDPSNSHLNQPLYIETPPQIHKIKHPTTAMPDTAQSPAFKKAIEDSRKLKSLPTNDELLEVSSSPNPNQNVTKNRKKANPVPHPPQLYALFKQGSGHKIADAEAPGMFDLKVRLPPPYATPTKILNRMLTCAMDTAGQSEDEGLEKGRGRGHHAGEGAEELCGVGGALEEYLGDAVMGWSTGVEAEGVEGR